MTRFPTGLAHYVFDVMLESGSSAVVRIGTPSSSSAFAGAEYWSRTLRPLGVPLPELLQAGQHEGMPYLILERLPGTDLGFVYRSLSTEQKKIRDTTRKNVIIDSGPLSGIDPLFTIALTRTALQSADENPDYITHWCDCLQLSDDQHIALSLYTAVFCLDFLAEVGHRFNRAEAIAVDAAHAERLLGTLHTALSELS